MNSEKVKMWLFSLRSKSILLYIRLKINNETELEKVRDYLYGQETDEYRKSDYQTDDIVGLLYEEEYITRYTAQDCPTYKQIKQSREKSGGSEQDSGIGAIGTGNTVSDSDNGVKRQYALKGSDKVMTELPDERVTVKDVLRGKATIQ